MDINKLTAMANRLSIPQLQQAMRDGSLPAYVGIPLLQQKVQESKQLQAAQAAGRPQAPTVASQVEGEADQHELMKRQALAMQEQMAGTGGISDMLRKPEAMAKGGAVAFNGEERSYVDPSASLYDEDLSIDDATALRALSPDQLNYYSTLPNGRASAAALGRQILKQNAAPQRYRNILPTGDITADTTANVPYFKSELPAKKPYSSDMPEMQALTKKMLANKPQTPTVEALAELTRHRNILPTEDVTTQIKGVDIPSYAPTNVQEQNVAVQPQPAVRGITPLAPGMAETLGILNQGGTGDTRSMAERMQLRQAPAAQQGQGQGQGQVRAPYTPAVAPQGQLSAPAQAAAQTLAAETTPQADKPRSTADYVNELKGVLGEGKSNAALKDFLDQQGKEYSEAKGKAPWMALLQAGLATMAGTSPFALANIGAGAQTGFKSYADDMKDLRKEQDKARELQIKAAQLQDEKDLAIAKFGVESKHSDDIQARQDRNTDKQIASHEKIAQLQADVTRAGQAITAANSANSLALDKQRLEYSEPFMRAEYAKLYTQAQNEKDLAKKALLEQKLKGIEQSYTALNQSAGLNGIKQDQKLAFDYENAWQDYLSGKQYQDLPRDLTKEAFYNLLKGVPAAPAQQLKTSSGNPYAIRG